jgi:predicted peptidase
MKRTVLKRFLLISGLLFVLACVYLLPKMINQGTYKKYLLYVPPLPPESGKYPLLLYLHGSGERGNDLSELEDSGPRPFLMQHPEYPFVLVSPLCRANDHWHSKYLADLIHSVSETVPVDMDRIYVTGLSMGGNGTWHMAQDVPDLIAAIAPVCGRSWYDPEQVKAMKDVSVWAFHGDQDDLVPIEESRRIVDQLTAMNADVRFTIYEGKGHAIWDTTYANPGLYEWFLSHSKAH